MFATMQRWLIITFALGAVFLANQVREFFVLDFSISSSSFGSMYYRRTNSVKNSRIHTTSTKCQ